jgi:zinc ribbon protein
MAFCTNCGKSLEEGARFCTNCGTPAQAASVPASAVAPVAAAPAIAPPEPSVAAAEIPSPQPVPAPPFADAPSPIPLPPAEASVPSPYTELPITPPSSTSPVFVIVCIVLLVLIAGGIAGTVYFQKRGKAKVVAAEQGQSQVAEPEPSSNTPSATPTNTTLAASTPTSSAPAPVSTPAPTPSAPALADSIRVMNLGNYPGATPVAIATLTGETVVAGFLTRDTPQQVMQFYKVRFPVSTTTESEGKADLNAILPDGAHLRIHAEPQGPNTQVMILQAR